MRRIRMTVVGASLLALVLSACGTGDDGPDPTQTPTPDAELPTVTVGSAGFYEAALVAEIYAQALEARGFTVTRQLELGERPTVHAALTSDQVNLIPEYLGGGLAELGGTPTADADQTHSDLADAFEELGFVVLDYSPGTDADGFVVRSETAEELGLETMSDLAEVADQLTWGLAPGCPENPVCGPGLLDVYGIDIDQLEVESLAPCSTVMAEALNAGAIDVAQVCTTQPDIERFGFFLLEDDGGLQPAQNLAPVASRELAEAGGSDFADALNAVSAELTTEELTSLGVLVAVEQQSYDAVARQWLEDHDLN
jgi:osmoprotectant transport system substrate-binding protein